MKDSDDLLEQSTEDGEVNDPDDTFKGSDDSKDQTKETQPPRAKKVKVEPFVIPKKVNDFEYKEFKTTLFALFKANGQQQLPMEDVKMTIFEKTRLTKGQLKTCIEKGSELNLFMVDSNILYIIDESNEVWFGGSDDSKEQNTEDVDVVKKVNDTDDNLKGSNDSKDQTNEIPPPKAVNRNLKNNAPLTFLPKITSSLPTISWAIANPAHSDTSKISDDSKKGSDDSKDQSTEDGEINDTLKVSDDPDDQTKETRPPIHKKHKKKKNKKDKREKHYRKHENLSNKGEVVSISGQSGSTRDRKHKNLSNNGEVVSISGS